MSIRFNTASRRATVSLWEYESGSFPGAFAMLNPIIRTSRARFDHPARFSREIGRIIVRWAFIEHLLQMTIWELAGVDDKVGRLAVREPRAMDRFELVRDLALLRGITLPDESARVTRLALDKLGATRDLLAHGMWTKTGRAWRVILSRGKYAYQPTKHSKNRKIDPEGLNVSLASLTDILGNVDRTIESVRNLRAFVLERLRA